MKDAYKDFVVKISNATEAELVSITFEMIEYHIDYALKNKDNKELYFEAVNKANLFLNNLIESLDFSIDISIELVSIYKYCSGLLLKAKLSNANTEELLEVQKILHPIYLSFKEIESESDEKQKVMSNTSQVYAGLTYGRKGLNEYIEESTVGFKA